MVRCDSGVRDWPRLWWARAPRAPRTLLPVLVGGSKQAGCQEYAPDHHHHRLHNTTTTAPTASSFRPDLATATPPPPAAILLHQRSADLREQRLPRRPPESLPFTASLHHYRKTPPPPAQEFNCTTWPQHRNPCLSHTRHRAFFAAAAITSPPFFPSGLVIDHRLPHNTPPTPPKCLPQSSSVAASPSPRGSTPRRQIVSRSPRRS